VAASGGKCSIKPDRNVVRSSRLSLASNIQILIRANYPLTLNSAAYSKEGINFPIIAKSGVSRRHMQSFVRLAVMKILSRRE
jgi:hypothetical protein